MTQVPLAPPPPSGNANNDRWFWLLWRRLTQAGQMLWSSLDFTGSNLTDLETRNHSDLQNINTASYTHLTSTERTDLLGATYITIDHTGASLTNERALAVGTGLNLTDGGAGSSITVDQVEFVGDSGSGGYIGAVPAPATGDGTAGTRKYLSADGNWHNPAEAGDVVHNQLSDLQGGTATGVFQTDAFYNSAFATGVIEYFHVTEDQFDNLTREASVLSTAINATLDDTAATCLVTTSGLTITLPNGTVARIGKNWTIVLTVPGYVDVTINTVGEFVLPETSDVIRLDGKGSSLTVRLSTLTKWVIV